MAFGAIMSNRYRIYYLLRGTYYTIRSWEVTQHLRRLGNRIRGGADQYLWGRSGGGGFGTAVDGSLNTILFDNTEMMDGLLLRREDDNDNYYDNNND